MAAPTVAGFDGWLSKKLLQINPDVDLEVFVSYIRSIVESEDDFEEASEALNGILGEIVEGEDTVSHCGDIISKWQELSQNQTDDASSKGDDGFEVKMSSLIKNQKTTKPSKPEMTSEEKKRKAAILAQYSQVDGDSDEEGQGKGDSGSQEANLAQNMNALKVDEVERVKREKMRAEHEQKKAKDKEDREKQAKKAQERKETEKKRTQKGEKHR
ncbi:hypothetical protein LSAT2_007671 [Lamellibrachia satsuma]|nr:hypothetical protein LSAT2_007671 [Lamellibrachia satsuma]